MTPKKQGVHLDIKHLRKKYGNTEVLKGINLTIEPGEFVAIVGKSGCGKSTLLRHLAGLETESSGEISLNGEILRSLNKKARFMFQDARLLPWEKVAENVGVGLGLVGNWKDQALFSLKQVGLEEREGDWPSVLSGGQKQRVSLARALVTKPQLLLLDEPLGALDALTRIEMQELIEDIWKEHRFTAVLVTHDVSEAITLADRVILIEDGKITMDLQVPLPRPRERGSAAFGKLENKVLSRVMKKDYQILLDEVTTV
ncbi:ATP-binding cassette domain-containing protein [Domibacillus sp. DTU_2020_1001157_1_SI_ALB_TIR_016]|uniref:ATP-binding cassette domain-containing protein n=1 Tax=Domibacillus sp. DTU_2020_1001157_1_SI_ALB_TIR_016 TaxID=3077789 RepID=UPI0028EA519D|nr:ATP-binding cassette domain-containing protein [Domibacillus sp. DTU_2020_1001157_1_SI_ALB_TIR_016]WNS78355.1 ATP-binding cassette domain-containing protein [Domibacillus sp. DTU_2020_1001157_1_SI_ALB_TIR_016]